MSEYFPVASNGEQKVSSFHIDIYTNTLCNMCKIWKGVTPIPPTTQPPPPLPSPSPYPTKMRQTYLAETYQSIRNSHSIGIRM